MDKLDAAIERRIDGKRPTARQKWIAFHRLYRIATNTDGYREHAALDCFRVLLPCWDHVNLMEADERSVSRVKFPVCIRRQLLATERRRRIHGPRYEWLEADRRVANRLRQEGREMTPEEVGETRQAAIRAIREKAAEHKIPLPADDRELLAWLNDGR
jgi:hypothetical protein